VSDGSFGRAVEVARKEYTTSVYQSFKKALAATETPCWWCGVRRAVSPDHVVPLVLGGTNAPENLVGACLSCQYSRGGKLGQSLKRARRRNRRTLEHPWP
jgi:5-methylcytosine-specific restriction endonuclease McrA